VLVDVLELLHVGDSLLHSLQHLSLHNQDLLKCWGRVGIIVVIFFIHRTVASVGHLTIMKQFATEIGIKIKDLHLYASRYNDD
jgi:hypothetical protein